MTAGDAQAPADAVSENLPRNRRYAVVRAPDLMTVTPGAQVRYECVPREGNLPQSFGGGGPYRDRVSWYKFREQSLVEETRARDPQWGRPVEKGPPGQFYWRYTWNEAPGRYVVAADIAPAGGGGGGASGTSSFCFLPQYVESAGLVLRRSVGALAREGVGLPPAEAEVKVAKLIANLEAIAASLPAADPAQRREHQETVERWKTYGRALRGVLAPTDGRHRIAVRAVHIEAASQVQRPLLLFLARLDGGDETGLLGGTKQRWVLVDWTDPTDSRFRGTYEGTGETAEEAIRGALSAWDWGNRYPAGHLTCDIPRTALGRRRQLRHEMETDGKTFGDEVRGVLEWIAVGGMVVAGVVLLFTPFQPVAAGALAVSVLSSTGAATIAIYDRHSQGIFDWRADVIDGLTIVGNLFAAGAAGAAPRWLRGARVRGMFEDGADRIFFGALIGVDLIQGILVADSLADELEALTKDGELSPEERHRKLMELLRSGAAATAITYISLRASVRAMANRDRKASAFTGDDRTRPIDEKLADLPNPDRGTPDRAIDVSRPPAAEGHTDKPQHATRGETGGSHHAKLISPAETELATSYPRDSHPWRKHYIDDSLIELVDKDGFTFKAECTDGSLSVTIVTNVDPATTDPDLMQYFRWAKKKEYSTVFWAKDLFRRMYDHFEQVGNPVKRLEGTWAWDNYAVAKAKYDELRGPPRRLSPKEAAKLAVLEAKTYVTYHRPRGFTKVVYAEHIPSIRQFAFRIEYEAPPQ